MKKLGIRDMEESVTLESSWKTIAILGDRFWPQTAKEDEDMISKRWLCTLPKYRNVRPNAGGVAIRSRNGVLRPKIDAWSMLKRLRQATNEYAPAPLCGFSPVLWGWRRLATTQ